MVSWSASFCRRDEKQRNRNKKINKRGTRDIERIYLVIRINESWTRPDVRRDIVVKCICLYFYTLIDCIIQRAPPWLVLFKTQFCVYLYIDATLIADNLIRNGGNCDYLFVYFLRAAAALEFFAFFLKLNNWLQLLRKQNIIYIFVFVFFINLRLSAS